MFINLFFLVCVFFLKKYTNAEITKGISIYGLETPLKNFVCSWVHPVEFYIENLRNLGFNVIRLPFSYEYIMQNDLSKMDHFMEMAYVYNMNVVLDLHRIRSSHQSPTPEDGVSINEIISMWKNVLRRYEHYSNFIGHNCYNEYQGQNIPYLQAYHQLIFTEIELEFPNRFIYFATGYTWSGNIHGFSLEHLPFHDRIVYSVHKYIFSGTGNEQDWEYSFGNEFPPEKLCIGEWGWKQQNPEEVEWAQRFIQYLKRKNIRNTAFWTIAHSGDTDGIYLDDCITLDKKKYQLLQTLWM